MKKLYVVRLAVEERSLLKALDNLSQRAWAHG